MGKRQNHVAATPAMEAALQRVVEAAGSKYQIALALRIHRTSVGRWKKVPAEQCEKIEKLYGVPRAILRPDIYGEGE